MRLPQSGCNIKNMKTGISFGILTLLLIVASVTASCLSGAQQAAVKTVPDPAGPLYQDGQLIFYYPAEPETKSVTLRSSRLPEELPLRRKGGSWSVSVSSGDPEGFDYLFVVTAKNGQITRKNDPYNKAALWSSGRPSVYHAPDTSRPVLHYYPETQMLVMLPGGYFRETTRKYPVIYWLDGQNMPAGTAAPYGGWKADSTAERLISEGLLEPVIQVGVFNTAWRMNDYSGWAAPVPEGKNWPYSESEEYRQRSASEEARLLHTVKPAIDQTYRTLADREHTAIGGSSAGAMMALYMAFSHPDTYGRVLAFAGGEVPYRILRERLFKDSLNLRIYLDCGTAGVDAQLLPESRAMGEFLQVNGYTQGRNLMYRIIERDPHNEAAWARRLPEALSFIFPGEI